MIVPLSSSRKSGRRIVHQTLAGIPSFYEIIKKSSLCLIIRKAILERKIPSREDSYNEAYPFKYFHKRICFIV